MFDTYIKLGFGLPALIPQIYLRYDPYSLTELNGVSRLTRQRMDFLLLMNQRARAVIEVDGIQHCSRESDQAAKQQSVSARPAAPRTLRGNGGGGPPAHAAELRGLPHRRPRELGDHAAGESMLTDFFTRLLSRHGHLSLEKDPFRHVRLPRLLRGREPFTVAGPKTTPATLPG
ncbi:hypothetical protein [Streptomyces sp. KR55]|uniref:hypothetical protein n=1 Tax=Streptomyces sp. KR55 TaxID=3457425 RepID=UPI003FD553F1